MLNNISLIHNHMRYSGSRNFPTFRFLSWLTALEFLRWQVKGRTYTRMLNCLNTCIRFQGNKEPQRERTTEKAMKNRGSV